MPELPEVETTVRGLQKTIKNLVIENVWTDLATKDKRKRSTVADVEYFKIFKMEEARIFVPRIRNKIFVSYCELRNLSQARFLNRLSQADEPRMSEKSADFYATVQKVAPRKSFVIHD